MILYYVGNEPKLKEAMISFFEEIQAEYQLLSDEDLEQTIESLLVKTSQKEKGNRSPYLIMDGYSPGQLESLAKQMHERHLDIGRLAMKTETNQTWTLSALMDEIDEEYAYFQSRDRLYALLISPDKALLEKDAVYRKTLAMAYSLLEDGQAEKEYIDMAISSIEKMLEHA